MEEHWTDPRGGIMLGLHRDTRPGKDAFFEFLRIEQKKGELFYIASPRGRPGTPFKLISSEENKAVFSNPGHDFPQRIIYWLGDDGALHARIEGDKNGEIKFSEWAWKRVE